MNDHQESNELKGPDFFSDDLPIFKARRDEEWKNKVWAERDLAEQEEQKNETPTDPAFLDVVSMLINQAMVSIGAVPHPATGQPMPDPRQAQLFIEGLKGIQKKTKGHLSAEEAKVLDGSVDELNRVWLEIEKKMHGLDDANPEADV